MDGVKPAAHHRGFVAPDRFSFLNQSHSLSDHGWDDADLDKLWRYTDYFDDLTAPRSDERLAWHEALLRRWVKENPPARGTGWEPYPTSLRIVNWGQGHCPATRFGMRRQPRRTDAMADTAFETHLLGNHLFANAKALVFAGLFFDGEEVSWRRRARLNILGTRGAGAGSCRRRTI